MEMTLRKVKKAFILLMSVFFLVSATIASASAIQFRKLFRK